MGSCQSKNQTKIAANKEMLNDGAKVSQRQHVTNTNNQKKQADNNKEKQQTTNFAAWLKQHGPKTTLLQQEEHIIDLYNHAAADGPGAGFEDPAATAPKVLKQLESLHIPDAKSLVTWKGIQVGWLLNVFFKTGFLEKLRADGCELWYLRKVGVIEIVRRTKKTSEDHDAEEGEGGSNPLSGPFVNHIYSVARGWDLPTEFSGKPIVADATTFISYTGAYSLDYLIEVLHQLDPNEYIWFDVFCVDQFAWTGKSRSKEMEQFRETFMNDLQEQIKAINKTALILQEWTNVMTTLEQMWVLWEIFNTAQAKAELQVLLPQSQIQHFVDNCLESDREFDSIVGSLANIDASKARADNDADRLAIYHRMERMGWSTVNSVVASVIRGWLLDQGKQHLARKRETKDGPSALLLNQLASLARQQGNLAEAGPLFRECVQVWTAQLGENHLETLAVKNNLASLLKDQGSFAEAEDMYLQVLKEEQRQLGESHPMALTTKHNLALLLQKRGKLLEAETQFRQALEGRQQELGDRHPHTLTTQSVLATLWHEQNKLPEAEALYRETLAAQKEECGDVHPDTLSTKSNLALILQKQGSLAEAEVLFREVLEGQQILLGESHPDATTTQHNLAQMLQTQGRLSEAQALFTTALEGRQRRLGDLHSSTINTKHLLGNILSVQGDLEGAESMCRQVLEGKSQLFGESHAETLTAKLNLAVILSKLGLASKTGVILNVSKAQESKQLMEEAWRGLDSQLGSSHRSTMTAKKWYIALSVKVK